MENLFDSGIELILWLQSIGDWIVAPMQAFTFLGVEEFYLVILPLIYWCFDPNFGLRIGIVVMLSGGFNDILKVAFHTPRPFWYNTAVRAQVSEYQFGLPSGHAQNAVAFWGYWAWEVKKRWFWALTTFLILVIGFSRLILGMHFHIDVLAGWMVGIVFLWAFIRLEPAVRGWMAGQKPVSRLAAIFIFSLAMIGLFALTRAALGDWQIPPAWVENAKAGLPEEPASPLAYEGIVSKMGVLFGLSTGAVLIRERGNFNVTGTTGQKIIRYLLGLIGTLVFWAGLDMLFPEGETLIALLFRYLRYGLTGFWVAAGAPMAFMRIGLMEKD